MTTTSCCSACKDLKAQYGARAVCPSHCPHPYSHDEGLPCVPRLRRGRPRRHILVKMGGTA